VGGDGCVAGWLEEERGRWDRAFARVARRAFAAAVAAGAADDAVATGRRWSDRDPLDVDVTITVVEACARSARTQRQGRC
jgi:DNA-binding SARP family transcriptional activator